MKTIKYSNKKKILAIDDSELILNFISKYLSKNYEVVTYQSSSAALKDLASCEVTADLIVTDYQIPDDLSGLEFTQQLREVDPLIPVMVLSGSCDINEKVECLRNGVIDFVNKPFNPSEFGARIENSLAMGPMLNTYRHAI